MAGFRLLKGSKLAKRLRGKKSVALPGPALVQSTVGKVRQGLFGKFAEGFKFSTSNLKNILKKAQAKRKDLARQKRKKK